MNRFLLSFFISIMAVLFCLNACSDRPRSKNSGDATKFQQYYVQGQHLYNAHCSNCHQKNGKGLKQIYPPLDNSDFMEQNFETTICLIKYGISGEITVNGKRYNQIMQGIPKLATLEIAEIATYIYNRGHHDKGIVEAKTVEKIIKTCQEDNGYFSNL